MSLPDPNANPDDAIDTDLFISHASIDDATVSLIDAALNAAGITTWVDHEHGIGYGDRWQQAISDATLRCRAALYILTPDSARSEWCEKELTRVREQLNRPVYVLKLTTMHDWQIPLIVNNVQYADFSAARVNAATDPRLASLATALQGKGKFDKTITSTRRTARITGSYPYGDLLYTLYGRDTDLSTVLGWLTTTDRQAPIAMLLGIGGVGKTRLAVEIVDRLDLDLPDGAIWFEFDSTQSDDANSPDRVADLIRTHFNLPPGTSDVAWNALNERQTLLVLDNAEDCPFSQREAFARRLTRLQFGPRVLITSRHAWDELDLRRERDLHAPSAADGVKILTRMAEVRDYTARLAGQADQIAQAARYHPRLMLYAVGWLKANPPQAVIKALETLRGREIEKALAEMVGQTLDQMTAQDGDEPLAALRRLNVTRGGFDREAAEALLADQTDNDPMLDVLSILVDWNLVDFDGTRYTIDPLVARTAGEDDTARSLHLDHFLMRAERQHAHQDYATLESDSDNLETAFNWAVKQQLPLKLLDMVWHGGQFLLNRGRVHQNFEWAQKASKFTNEHIDAQLWARAQNSLGLAYRNLSTVENKVNNLNLAIEAYRAALIYRIPPIYSLTYAQTQNNIGLAYRNLSTVENKVNNLRLAIEAFQKALIYRTPETPWLALPTTLNNLGTAYRDLASIEDRIHNLHLAIDAFQQALAYYLSQGAMLDYAMTQNNLGLAYSALAVEEDRNDNLYLAIEAYGIALRYRTPIAAPLDYAETKRNLGFTLLDLEDKSGAYAAWQEAEIYFRRYGNTDMADRIVDHMRANDC